MTDTISKEKRSANMSAIKNKNTKLEVYFRKKLFSQGLRYRKNTNTILGHPDIYLGKFKTAVFINGCFWHRHENCKFSYSPKSNVDFWNRKFESNRKRDIEVKEGLLSLNLKCIIVWECTIKKMMKDLYYEQIVMKDFLDFIQSPTNYLEL